MYLLMGDRAVRGFRIKEFIRNYSSKTEWNRRKVNDYTDVVNSVALFIIIIIKDRKLIDWKKVRVQAGKGGDGLVSFKQ